MVRGRTYNMDVLQTQLGNFLQLSSAEHLENFQLSVP